MCTRQALTIDEMIEESHSIAKSKGWWDDDVVTTETIFGKPVVSTRPAKSIYESLFLVMGEVAEAGEELRNGHAPSAVYFVEDRKGNAKPEGCAIELADVIIRVFDLCGRFGIDLQTAYRLKTEYNKTRDKRHGGKDI